MQKENSNFANAWTLSFVLCLLSLIWFISDICKLNFPADIYNFNLPMESLIVLITFLFTLIKGLYDKNHTTFVTNPISVRDDTSYIIEVQSLSSETIIFSLKIYTNNQPIKIDNLKVEKFETLKLGSQITGHINSSGYQVSNFVLKLKFKCEAECIVIKVEQNIGGSSRSAISTYKQEY